MFIFLVLSFLTLVLSLSSILYKGFDITTFVVFIISVALTGFFYYIIKDENSDWGCD